MCQAKFAIDEHGMGADAPVTPLAPELGWIERHGSRVILPLCVASSITVIGLGALVAGWLS